MAVGLATAGLGIAAGLYGQMRSAEDRKRQEQMIRAQMAEIDALQIPEEEKLQYKAALMNDIAKEEAILQGQTSLDSIQLDPALRQAQMQALASLESQSRGEFGAEERARLDQIQRQAQQAERGSRGAIMQGMQRRGISGSGLELAAQLQNQQASADRQAMEGVQLEAQAKQRALDALSRYGAQARGMEEADYGRSLQAAQARDAIERFNVGQRTGVQQRNVGATRDIGLANVQAQNQASRFNAGAVADRYNMQQNKARLKGGALGGLGDMYGQRARDTQRMYSGMGSALATGGLQDIKGMTSAANALAGSEAGQRAVGQAVKKRGEDENEVEWF